MTNIGSEVGRTPAASVSVRATQYPQPANKDGNYRYQSKIPDLADDASIQDALKMYHYGQANYDPNSPIVANSVEGWMGNLQHQVDDLYLRPGGGGEVKTTEPVLTPTGQSIPDGYIWVDKDDISLTYPEFPTVLYSPTQPTGLGVGDVGTIWVDSDSSVDVLSLTDYQPITKYTSNAPLTPITGQMWIDSDTVILYFYDGSSWKEVTSPVLNTFFLMGA